MGNFTSAPTDAAPQRRSSLSSQASSRASQSAPHSAFSPFSPYPPGTPSSSSSQPIAANPRYRSKNESPSYVFGSPLTTPVPFSLNSNLKGEDPRQTFPAVVHWNQGGSDVAVIGDFNHWKEGIPLTKSHEDFTTVLSLPPGTHEFRFIVDGEVRCSSDFPTVLVSAGNLLNYVEVGPPEDIPANFAQTELEVDDEESFSQAVPTTFGDQEPPKLPPHLNKVILNSENVSNDPSVLPVPHHVMLNHLYALSIRDRVMVLATSSRFKQKYVTTVLYKPVFS